MWLCLCDFVPVRLNLKPDESIMSHPAWRNVDGKAKYGILVPGTVHDITASHTPGKRRKV